MKIRLMQRIADLLKEDCCIFIGAGIPKALGFPLWNELAQDLIDFVWSKRDAIHKKDFNYSMKLELEDYVKKGKSITAITYCRDMLKEAGQENEYQDKIKKLLHDKGKYEKVKNNDIYVQLQTS